MEKAVRIQAILLSSYGQREWTPTGDPLGELMLTILSQHTSDANSRPAYASLRRAFPCWEDARDAEPAALARAIHQAGLGNIKSLRIKEVLLELTRRGGFDLSFLTRLEVPAAKAWLTSLKGVGPKTAACVLLFALGLPALPVDTHVHRVAIRLGLVPSQSSADKAHEILETALPRSAYHSFHINLITHGRTVCKARRPLCDTCCLNSECAYFGSTF